MASTADKCRGARREWQWCSVCAGRIHLPECGTRRDKMRDCCYARHAMLHSDGETIGRDDASQPMFDPNNRTWAD
jgi:hypothetical protein